MNNSAFNNKNITCCFTGHRALSDTERMLCLDRITQAVEALISMGVTHFIAGGAVGFDTIAEVSVLNLKKRKYPEIKLTVAVPFPGQPNSWSAADKALYHTILSEADEVVTLSKDYHPGCMSIRNRYMVDRSVYCLCYVTKDSGGSFYTAQYAQKKGLKVYNLALVSGITVL